MFENYKNKVSLLIKVLPIVSKERSFALHGGTAINLFIRELPRLSVDMDLTYIPLEDRETSLKSIDAALAGLKTKIEKAIKGSKVDHQVDRRKLIIIQGDSDIKLEVNTIIRGIYADKEIRELCKTAKNEFEAFVETPLVPFGQLYGGKICAALDRQHPRDVFDVKYLLENEGI